MKKISLKYIIFLIILFFCCAIIIFIDLFPRIKKDVIVQNYSNPAGVDTISKNETKDYKIVNNSCDFDILYIYIEGENSDNIYVYLQDETTGKVCVNKVYNSGDIGYDDNGKAVIPVSSGKVLGKHSYKLSITNLGTEDVCISTVDDNNINYSMVKKTNVGIYLLIIVIILFAVYLCTLAFKLNSDSFGIEKFYLITAIFMGIIYLLVIPPWAVPDSTSHFGAAYRFSSILLGHTGEEEWTGRADDELFLEQIWEHMGNPDMKDYTNLLYNFKITADNNELIEMSLRPDFMKYYSIINYWPQIIGIILSRLFRFSAVIAIYLGRIFLLAFYIYACLNAVKKTPIGKSFFALVPLLPMSLMMSSGYSYDAMVIISTLNFVACIFALYKDQNSVKLLVETSIWAFMIGAVKGGGYLIMLPLILILLFKSENMKKSSKNIAIIAASGLISVFIFDKLLQLGNKLFQFGYEDDSKMQAVFAIKHPIHYFHMLISTYLNSIDKLFFNMMGTQMAWLESTIPATIIIFMVLALFIYSLYEKDDITLESGSKWILLGIVFMSVFFTPMMLLSWTEIGADTIAGLQGRYYLPLIVPMLIFVSKYTLNEDRENFLQDKNFVIRNKCMMCFAILSCIAVYYMLRLYLTR